MADYDFDDEVFAEEEPVKKKKSTRIDTLDIFSILLVIGSLCLGGYFLLILANPYQALNPFPPDTPVPPIILPTATITPLELAEVWTPTSTIQPTITNTPRPTFTEISTATVAKLFTDTPTPEPPTATATPEMPFEANVQLVDSKIIHAETNCNWLGVGGKVEDKNGSPMLGVVVRIQGSLLGAPVDMMTVSGVSQIYGQSGFEFVLGDLPLPTEKTLWIRLFDSAGLPLSDEIYLNTSAACEENLVLVQFKQVR